MAVKKHLGRDEKIMDSYETRENEIYATDSRLVRYISGLFKEDIEDMNYDYIASIDVHRSGSWKFPVTGIIIALVGFLLFRSYFLAILGGIITFFGVLYRSGYYLVKGGGGEKMVICRHKYLKGFWTGQREEAEKFIREIRGHM